MEGREAELRNGIRVPALTRECELQDEFPGQQQTTMNWTIPSAEQQRSGARGQQKGGEFGMGRGARTTTTATVVRSESAVD